MALTKHDIDTLEEIVAENGHCLNSKRCGKCPFRAMCLPEFLNVVPPSEPQRLKMAVDVLLHHQLLDPEVEISDMQKDNKWDKQ